MNKDYTKELNEIEEQIKEQQESIKEIKVQVKGQVEQLEKEDLKKKRVIKRKLKNRLRKQNKKRKEINLFKHLFYISILIVIVLLFFVCNKIKELDTVNKKLETVNKELDIAKKQVSKYKNTSNNSINSDEYCKICKVEEDNLISCVYQFNVPSENSIE